MSVRKGKRPEEASSRLCIEQLELHNFRCFDTFDITFEPDLTIIFAENGGGKTALLAALAIGLALLQPPSNRDLKLEPERDARRARGNGHLREPSGPCRISCTALIGEKAHVSWRISTTVTSRRGSITRLGDASSAIEQARMPGQRWPLIGYYGTDRLVGNREPVHKASKEKDRWDGYAGCLDPSATDGPLLDWLRGEAFGDIVRQKRGEPERRLDIAVFNAMKRATPGVAEIWYDPALDSPVVRFDEGQEAPWRELSDGFHVFMGLVGDIARRAAILNGQDGAEAPLLVEGVVLIDEIDLHLHPRWQRVVLDGLRAAFPKLQLIVTTHSPQVLSSAKNRQVRRLVDWTLQDAGVFVEGRDSNSILRELMHTDDRDEAGRNALRNLYAAIDNSRLQEAQALLTSLREKWGDLDPELIRAEGFLAEEVI